MSARGRPSGPDPRSSGPPAVRSRTRDGPDDRRTRRLLRRLSAVPSYAEELRLDIADRSNWFGWFLSASLFAKPIAATTALRTASLLLRSGIRTPAAIEGAGWDGLVRLLDQGGYVRYDFSTADKLLGIAQTLRDPEVLRALAREPSYPAVEKQLTRMVGVGPKTVEIFLRELQGTWQCSPPWSREARRAARRLGLSVPDRSLAPSHRRRVENGLVRVWLEHCKPGRWRGCPAGVDCGCRPPSMEPSLAFRDARNTRSSRRKGTADVVAPDRDPEHDREPCP